MEHNNEIPAPPVELFNIVDLVTKRAQFLELCRQVEEQYNTIDASLRESSDFSLRRQLVFTTDPLTIAQIKRTLRLRSEIESYTLSAHLCTRLLSKHEVIRAESGDLASSLPMEMKEEENVKEISTVSLDVSGGRSRNARQGQEETLDMSSFLERPVEIYTSSLSMASHFNIKLSVWDLFTKLPAVRSKLRNYAYLRGNLKVKISIAGTPFHYGRVLASYQPLSEQNANLIKLEAAASVSDNGRVMLLNYLSQSSGSAVMNINENVPVIVNCPYISPQPMARLFNYSASVLGTSTSYSDLEDMGALYIRSINVPLAVSASPTPLYIQVYAWMEDVQLGTTTGTQIAITTESGKLDERKVGPVERIATRVFDISSRLTKVPYLYPYAKASEIASGAIKNVSALFGWSMPVLNQNTALVKNMPFCNGALTIGTNTSNRVVLDPMQELAIDSTIVGVEEDDMIISNIASRSTYLTTFIWADTQGAMVAPIWTCENSPNLVTYLNNGVNVFCQPTAMAYAALPFTYWRGSITYRFEVACSSFHRGRLAVFFEPNVAQRVLINSDISLNKQFIAVVDIQENDTFEVTVNWASSKPWLRVGTAQTAYLHSDQLTVAADGLANGYIGVIPFTSLQSPDSSDVRVNVYVRSDDLQVNGFTQANLFSARAIPSESGTIPSESGSCETVITQSEIMNITLNDSTASNDGLCEDYFGEQPLSFRSLLKRFVLTGAEAAITNTTAPPKVFTAYKYILPENNLVYDATNVTVNFDLFSYLRYAYLGMRGSMRVRAKYTGQAAMFSQQQMNLSLDQPRNTLQTSAWSSTLATNMGRVEGTAVFATATNSGVEAEFPYYSNNLFALSFGGSTEFEVTSASDATWFRAFRADVDVWTQNMGTAYMEISKAAGEDFTFLRYSGAPYYSVTPVA